MIKKKLNNMTSDHIEPLVEDTVILDEESDITDVGAYIGICKWFNNVYGYGFVTIWAGEDKGKDIFVHHSGIRPLNSQYKTLKKGEYISFDIIDGDKGMQAVNVRGINGGPLMCDQVQVRKSQPSTQGINYHTDDNGWSTVPSTQPSRKRGGKGGNSSPTA